MVSPFYESQDASAKRYARTLHDKYGVGKAECQNGMLLFLAIQDRKLYISTGQGMRKVITDSHITEIIEKMKPSLKNTDYFGAVKVFLELSEVLFSGGSIHSFFEDLVSFGILAAVLFFIGYSFYSCFAEQKKKSDFEACRKKLTELDKMKADIASKKYVCVSCPICLNEFEKEEDEKDDKTEKKKIQKTRKQI